MRLVYKGKTVVVGEEKIQKFFNRFEDIPEYTVVDNDGVEWTTQINCKLTLKNKTGKVYPELAEASK